MHLWNSFLFIIYLKTPILVINIFQDVPNLSKECRITKYFSRLLLGLCIFGTLSYSLFIWKLLFLWSIFFRMCPIFQVSNVTGENLHLLRMFLNLLSTRLCYKKNQPAEFQIDDTFSVPVSICLAIESITMVSQGLYIIFYHPKINYFCALYKYWLILHVIWTFTRCSSLHHKPV